MWVRLAGAIATVSACSCFGFAVASDYRRRIRMLRDFLTCLQEMTLCLQQDVTPLPELVKRAGSLGRGRVFKVMDSLSAYLSSGACADVPGCMRLALQAVPVEDTYIHRLFTELGRNLGRFDLPGQVQGLTSLSEITTSALQKLEQEQTSAVRVYRTLGIFGGMALAVLMI